MAPAAPREVQLTEQEKELFTVLKAVVAHSSPTTVLRCAGGWVRDKLLGKDSHDIDIALSDKKGAEFAEDINAYLASQAQTALKVAVILSNPDQSKHLETARMKLAGLEIDLVNLRSESYADSRIPTMEVGTPKEDALRRDFTINSLFYRIDSGEVEDFTERGLADLAAQVIRTPLPAAETFTDDPLRVLRAVRFGARFGFSLDAGIEEAASSARILAHPSPL
ncbi:hypothetical protein WJX81_001018 [Elliptochloris bilobata]|uniref:Poly A polymerase head domain-containing protein n=1 Tax=Elliptochloris bilobata TaxID=381761 RepID=A0AAW1RM45_9CHLO